MYKIVAIGKNGVRVNLTDSGEEIVFETYEEADRFLINQVDENMLPSNYEWSIIKA
ncbi:hypothetical protein ACFO3D_07950 [Virgibacillus kekensis]|uniref:Phage protein n=1 Tax=Virgibacillus kekensis TaxID=202261 RepID=A0ABV9DH62_9BACI